MWLRKDVSNDQAGVQQEHKATTTNVIKKKSSNEHACIQHKHKATTTNVIKKKHLSITRIPSNKDPRPQQPSD